MNSELVAWIYGSFVRDDILADWRLTKEGDQRTQVSETIAEEANEHDLVCTPSEVIKALDHLSNSYERDPIIWAASWTREKTPFSAFNSPIVVEALFEGDTEPVQSCCNTEEQVLGLLDHWQHSRELGLTLAGKSVPKATIAARNRNLKGAAA